MVRGTLPQEASPLKIFIVLQKKVLDILTV